MNYSITLKVDSEKPGCDPEAISSLGKLARMMTGEPEEETPEEDDGENETDETPTSLGKQAREYAGNGIRKHAMDLFDLRKVDLSNEYDDPKRMGNRTV